MHSHATYTAQNIRVSGGTHTRHEASCASHDETPCMRLTLSGVQMTVYEHVSPDPPGMPYTTPDHRCARTATGSTHTQDPQGFPPHARPARRTHLTIQLLKMPDTERGSLTTHPYPLSSLTETNNNDSCRRRNNTRPGTLPTTRRPANYYILKPRRLRNVA